MLQVYASKTEGDCSIFISCRGENRFQNFQQLQASKDAIERAVGGPLRWDSNESLNRAWIILNLEGLDPSQTDDWARQQQILAEKTVQFYRALDPFVRALEQPQT